MGGRLLGGVVDDATRVAGAVRRARRPLQDLHALDVEQLRHREAGVRVAAQPVVQDVLLAEATQHHAGVAEEAHAADVPVQVGDLVGGLVVDQFAIDHLDGLRHQFQRRVGPRGQAAFLHLVEALRATDHPDRIQVGHRGVVRGALRAGCVRLLGMDDRGEGCERGRDREGEH
jgi:hypothetical protein